MFHLPRTTGTHSAPLFLCFRKGLCQSCTPRGGRELGCMPRPHPARRESTWEPGARVYALAASGTPGAAHSRGTEANASRAYTLAVAIPPCTCALGVVCASHNTSSYRFNAEQRIPDKFCKQTCGRACSARLIFRADAWSRLLGATISQADVRSRSREAALRA